MSAPNALATRKKVQIIFFPFFLHVLTVDWAHENNIHQMFYFRGHTKHPLVASGCLFCHFSVKRKKKVFNLLRPPPLIFLPTMVHAFNDYIAFWFVHSSLVIARTVQKSGQNFVKSASVTIGLSKPAGLSSAQTIK